MDCILFGLSIHYSISPHYNVLYSTLYIALMVNIYLVIIIINVIRSDCNESFSMLCIYMRYNISKVSPQTEPKFIYRVKFASNLFAKACCLRLYGIFIKCRLICLCGEQKVKMDWNLHHTSFGAALFEQKPTITALFGSIKYRFNTYGGNHLTNNMQKKHI